MVQGSDGGTGVALFELYDLDPAGSRVANISSRGDVASGDNVMVSAFIISGDQATKVIVRAIGPSLGAHGVPDALQDPVLECTTETARSFLRTITGAPTSRRRSSIQMFRH